MTAHELAKQLDWHWDNDCRSPAISEAADMLRQQADEIVKLKLEWQYLTTKLEEYSLIYGAR